MAMRRSICPVLAASLLAATHSAHAQDYPEPALQDGDGTYTVTFENDWFARTDRNYTNGLRFSWLSGTHEPAGIAAVLADFVTSDGENALMRRGWSLGHQIYTPENVDTAMPLPEQQPYAGYLYGEYALVLEQADTVDQFAVQFGVVGPSAGGEQAQNGWHSLLGGDEAQGWDNQIDDTLGLTVSWDRQWRRGLNVGLDGFEFDVTPTLGASLGTVQTQARAGLMARFGHDLKSDYGPPRVRPARAGSGYFIPDDDFSWYAFAGIEAQANAHNIFLDGAPFRDGDPQVSSRPFTQDLQAGIVTQFARFRVTYSYIYRTERFKEQDDPQVFGAVSLSFKS